MNADPRQTIFELIVIHGPELCDDIARCEGFLRDYCPHDRGKVNVLISALKERVVADLLSRSASLPTELLIGQLAKRLEEHHAMREDMALWAVETWALALEKSGQPRVMQKPTLPISFKNSLGMKMMWCPPGEFLMGSPEGEKGRIKSENQVEVRISQGFWLASTPVTQGQWQDLMGSNPSDFRGKNLPVEKVSWDAAQEFCTKLNAAHRVPPGCRYALPSEAQWEYACRAGTKTVFAFGDTLASHQANFNGSYPYGLDAKGHYLGKTSEVASYGANPWGLYDMHGNVWEWCQDKWDGKMKLASGTDPISSTGLLHVLRGGSWCSNGLFCRSAFRIRNVPDLHGSVGFRVAALSAGAECKRSGQERGN